MLRVTLTVGFLLLLCLIVSQINSYNNKNKNTNIVHRIAVLSMTLKGQLNVDKDMKSGIMGWDMTSGVENTKKLALLKVIWDGIVEKIEKSFASWKKERKKKRTKKKKKEEQKIVKRDKRREGRGKPELIVNKCRFNLGADHGL